MVKNEYTNLKFRVKKYQPYQIYDKVKKIHGDIDLNDAVFNYYCLQYFIHSNRKFNKIYHEYFDGDMPVKEYDELRKQFIDAVYESNPWLENLDY